MLEAIAEERAIRQSRQRVMEGLMLELSLQTDTVCDVTCADDHRALTVEDRLPRVNLDVEHAAGLRGVSNPLEVGASSSHRVQVRSQQSALLWRPDLG